MIATSLAILLLIATLVSAFMGVAAIHATRAHRQLQGAQALAAAEGGIEAALDRLAREPKFTGAMKARLGEGLTYETTVRREGRRVVILSSGRAQRGELTPTWRDVRVTAERADSGYRVARWERVYVDRPALSRERIPTARRNRP